MAFDRDDATTSIADLVHHLVEPRRHAEPYQEWTTSRNRKFKAWVTSQPSLLDQLRRLTHTPTVTDRADGGRAVPRSRAPIGEDALDRLMAIEAGTAWWASIRLRRDLRDTVEDNLRLLVGASTRLEDHDLRDLRYDIGRFHGWAATLAGWQTPPFRPRAACPLCERMGTLRVLLDKKRATCLGCGECWSEDDGSIVLLADYIRELGERDTQEVSA